MSREVPPTGNTRGGAIAWMAGNPIAVNLLMIILLGGGFWTMFVMQKEVFPQFQLDVVEITVEYPGAAPAEVEQGILRPVEETVRGVQGIREITSTATEGRARVTIELVNGADAMQVFQDIDQAVNRIRTFPEDTEEPEIRLRTQEREVMEIGVYGGDVWSLRQQAERLRDRLLNEPGITQVQIDQVPGYVTHVEVPRDRLREYGLTVGDVAGIIARSSEDIPAGAVETHSGEILLRMQERKQWAEQFGNIEIVSSPEGGTITLADLAEITDGFEEEGFHGQFNRSPSVEVQVYRIGNQSPLSIAEAVNRVLEESRGDLPPGMDYRIDSNSADDFQQRLGLLAQNGLLAILIVFLILAAFLEYRLAFWVMMGMAISFIGGILLLPLADISINMISMFGFLVVLGIVVDDTIVVGENVYEYRQRGMNHLQAAIAGTRDISRPVIFSILTNIIAFVPLLFMPGTTGKYWWPLPAVVIIVLAVSLFEALFILPGHLGHARQKRTPFMFRYLERGQQVFAGHFNRFIDTTFRHWLDACLRFRYITLSAALALLLVVGGYGYSGHMSMILMPEVAADEIEAGVTLPVNTTSRQALQVADEITRATQRMFREHNLERAAEGIKTNVRGQNFIDVELVLREPDERDMSAQEIIELWRDEIGDIEGVDQITFEAERGPGGYRQDIVVDLSHADVEVLEAASRAFKERMQQFTATRDVTDNYNKGKTRFNFTLLPEGRRLGLTPDDVGRQLRDGFFGALALRYLRGTNEVEVRVKFPREQRSELYSLYDLVIRTPAGVEVPLLDVVEITEGQAFTTINRRDGRRVVSIGMDAQPANAVSRVLTAIRAEELPRLQNEYPGLTYSFQGAQADVRESTQALWGGFALAMAVIYALLAVAFGSYAQPVIVMGAVPFGVVGAVIGHILLGYDLSLVSLMGVIALSGVVLNDSLIMVDYANRLRGEGGTPFEAIHRAGLRRFRPIILTTLTTFGGLTPIILETSRQATQLIPMAISLGFGIVFATAIILVLVPCLYLILDDVQSRVRDRRSQTAAEGP